MLFIFQIWTDCRDYYRDWLWCMLGRMLKPQYTTQLSIKLFAATVVEEQSETIFRFTFGWFPPPVAVNNCKPS